MATYKVLQDVEAEDKLLGPLTLRQFVYAIIAAVFLYLSYFFAAHHAGFMLGAFLPVAFSAAFFAFPWGRDQPTEIWALAKIRFAIKPRRRIWDQSDIKELVTITAPKKVATNFSNNLSQEEVHSRLRALATTIDTRGWAVKNTNINLGALSPLAGTQASDRLITPTSLPKPVDETDIQAADDMLDEHSNAGAQRLQGMIEQSTKDHRDQVVANLENGPNASAPASNQWFLNRPGAAAKIPSNMVTFNTQVVTPGAVDANAPLTPVANEAGIVAQLDEHKKQSFSHMHSINPLSDDTKTPAPAMQTPVQPSAPLEPSAAPAPQSQTASAPVTPTPQTAILQLASNDDLNVATIAREAERSAGGQGEVVIKLH